MRVGNSIRGRGPSERSIRDRGADPTEPVFRFEVLNEDYLAVLHRRTRQVSALVGFNTSQQTEIGTAVSEMTRAALSRAGGGALEFALAAGAEAALSVRIRDAGPANPNFQSGVDDELATRIARNLIDDLKIELSQSGVTTVVLRRALPTHLLPLTIARINEIRRELPSSVPKSLVHALREQNRELREVQREFVLSELSLRKRIRQSALMTEVAAVLIETESIAAKLQRCAEEIVEQLDVESTLIWTADPAVGRLGLTASAGISSADPPREVEMGSSLLDLIGQKQTAYATDSALDDPRTPDREWASRQQMQAFAACPLMIEDKLIGVLTVYARESLATDRLETLRLLASQIAAGIDRQQRIAERERLLSSEREARLKAEAATRAKDRLLAVVSHDLRDPLSSVVTAAAMLIRAQGMSESPRLRRHLQTIINSADQMKRLISDLLDLASIEAGRLAFELSRQCAASLVTEMAQSYAPIADAKSIRLEAETDDFLPDIRCDRGRIVQVLSNLIGNAIKFTPEGGAISLRAFRAGSAVLFAVTDTGPGMPDEEQSHVFESYWQAKPGAGRGLGLGLSIAKALVEAHGGRIWVESRTGRGSTFFVSLPAQEPAARSDEGFAR